jgi:hypothetical protein
VTKRVEKCRDRSALDKRRAVSRVFGVTLIQTTQTFIATNICSLACSSDLNNVANLSIAWICKIATAANLHSGADCSISSRDDI